MLALITNDDGVESRGIAELARTATALGMEVVVAAPSWDSSGAAASLTAAESAGRLMFEDRRIDGVDARVIAVEASPAFITRSALSGAFGPMPDLVLSGINHGANTGYAVLHSGTVGAAFTAAVAEVPAAAMSFDTGGEGRHWDTAVAAAQRLLSTVDWPEHRGVVLNLNVPDLAIEEWRGLCMANLARVGAVTANVTEVGEGYVAIRYVPTPRDAEEGTDVALLDAGHATLTVLDPIGQRHDWAIPGVASPEMERS